MAVTTQGERLTEAHRRAQARNAAATALLIQRLFRQIVDPLDLSASTQAWLAAVLPIIAAGRRRSADLATSYVSNFRVLETGGTLDPIRFAPVLDGTPQIAIMKSLVIQGPGTIRTKLGVVSGKELSPLQESLLTEALSTASAKASAAAVRHVQNAGRDTISGAIEQDRAALGHVRVTKDNCCYFCAMLASRGPVYDDQSFDESDPRFTGSGDFKVHDSCGCELEPVYSRETKWPGKAAEFSEMWASLERPNIKEWRRLYEGRV